MRARQAGLCIRSGFGATLSVWAQPFLTAVCVRAGGASDMNDFIATEVFDEKKNDSEG